MAGDKQVRNYPFQVLVPCGQFCCLNFVTDPCLFVALVILNKCLPSSATMSRMLYSVEPLQAARVSIRTVHGLNQMLDGSDSEFKIRKATGVSLVSELIVLLSLCFCLTHGCCCCSGTCLISSERSR